MNLGSKSSVSGTYSREFAREIREAAKRYEVEALITDDYLEVEAKVAELQPELVLGTQMERHIAKRLGIALRRHLGAGACSGFSRPLLATDGFRRRQCDFRLLGSSVDDGSRRASAHDVSRRFRIQRRRAPLASRRRRRADPSGIRRRSCWRENPTHAQAEIPSRPPTSLLGPTTPKRNCKKIPFFVRGKARRNTERFAVERGVATITIETLYDAKAHFAR